MTLLEKYYYEHIGIDTPSATEDITDLLKPILDWDLTLEVDSLLGKVISESGLYGFKQGFELGKEKTNTWNL